MGRKKIHLYHHKTTIWQHWTCKKINVPPISLFCIKLIFFFIKLITTVLDWHEQSHFNWSDFSMSCLHCLTLHFLLLFPDNSIQLCFTLNYEHALPTSCKHFSNILTYTGFFIISQHFKNIFYRLLKLKKTYFIARLQSETSCLDKLFLMILVQYLVLSK